MRMAAEKGRQAEQTVQPAAKKSHEAKTVLPAAKKGQQAAIQVRQAAKKSWKTAKPV